MESSPASLTAMQMYLPESSAWALGICNTRPPVKVSRSFFSVLNSWTLGSDHIYYCLKFKIITFCLHQLPGKIRTLSLEANSCPSLYQVSVGGGTALVSQYKKMGLLRMTSRTSPLTPGEAVASTTPPALLKVGGTKEKEKKSCTESANHQLLIEKNQSKKQHKECRLTPS